MSANDNRPPKERKDEAKGAARPCPICGKPSDARYAPFCSKRCADVDLHRWLKGNYVIPGPETGERSEDDKED